MKEENMTFGQYIRKKRLDSPQELTLREISQKLDMSLSMYSDIEKDRRTPSDNFDYEKLASILSLDAAEKALMYDLAARRKRTVQKTDSLSRDLSMPPLPYA